MAANSLFGHLIPLKGATSLLKHGVDSIILVEQMHLWPRPEDERDGEWASIPSLVQSCCAGKPAPTRLHTVPEILELRVKGPSSAELSRRLISADESGSTPCQHGEIPDLCPSCTAALGALCLCARQGKSRLDYPSRYRHDKVRKCCVERLGKPQNRSAAANNWLRRFNMTSTLFAYQQKNSSATRKRYSG